MPRPVRSVMALAAMLAATTLLSGCFEEEHQDLDRELKELTKDLRGKIDPLPVIQPYTAFQYEVASESDPFGPAKIQLAIRSGNKGVQPDTVRLREPLEAFPLERVAMVGSIKQKADIFAIVRADGTLYRVKIGNYLGPNYGKIISITESEIVILELVQDSTQEWSERRTVVALQ